ncbi:MAG: nitroreductase family deazaflavin-dependent oxidoreductase [Actinobacteria bacterium]|nr:nitroreductase family deazaflavin-dependent oxidoreductase [Actinomycetota bacterium]
MSDPQDRNAKIIEEFRANDGRVGGPFAGAPLLLLSTTGARSGKARINPLMYLPDGDRLVVFASKGGAPTNPDWFHNLVADPHATVEVGTERFRVRAAEATGEERDRLFAEQAGRYGQFATYQTNTDRTIPVIVLEREG